MNRTQSEHILNIRTQIDNSERALKTLGDQLNDLWGKGNAPKSFTNSIDELANKLLSLREITKKDGMVDSSSLKQAESDSKKLAKEILSLKVSLQSLSEEQKKALVTGETKEKMEARAKAVKSYNEAIAEQTRLLKEQEELKKKIESAKTKKANLKEPVLGSAGQKVQKLQELQARKATITSNRQNLLNKGKSESSAEVTRLKELEEAVQNEIAALRIGEKTLEKGKQELKAYAEASKNVAEDTEAFEKEISELSNKLRKVDKALEVDAFEQLKKELKDLGVEGIENAKSFAEIEEVLKGLDSEAIAPVVAALNGMITSLDELEKEQKGVAGEIDKTTEALKEQSEAAKAKEAFEARIKQFLGLAGAAQVMRRALSDAFNTISELDAVMGQMSVVTDLSVGDYWEQLPEYAARAKELGVSITEAYEAATLYYQQGLKTNEVIAISTETMKMAAIAGISTADATDKMTAALRGFNMELNETSAQRVSDVYSELAAITAADVNEISDAMTKTASIASSAGMEFETTAAFLSQIIETTRESAETAGTALKTVIARFQELKKDPSEIGEVEGEIVDANAIETALRSVGVSLRDASGQFRELDDVFLELSGKWNTLDKNTQRYIATIAAGSRQQSRFIAMMQDYGRTQELVAAANNSAGASQRQFEKTTETLEYKINRLKTAWQEFTMGIMNSSLVKTGVDILTKFVNIINKATSGFQGLSGSITKIIGIVAIFNIGKTLYEKLSNPISNFFLGELPKMAYESGRKSMAQYQKGGQDQANGTAPEQKTEEEPEKKSIAQKAKDATGWSNFEKAAESRKKAQSARQTIADNSWVQTAGTKQQKADLQELLEIGDLDPGNVEDFKQELKEIEEAEQNIQKAEGELKDASKETWDNIGKGVQKAGQAITGAGVAFSAFGGILSSMGLEEAGSLFANIGNFAMIAGQAVSMLGPVIVSIVGKLVAGGISASLAWLWVTVIVAAIVGLIALVAVGFNEMKKNSPEGKLKAAQEAADKAAEAADNAKESYENLSSAMDELKDHYKTLDDLAKGTKEWNEQLRKTNSAVMDLIKDYPELAQFVSNQSGVLTIDMDSEGVQDVLNKAYEQTITTANLSILANMNVANRQMDVDRKNLKYEHSFVYDQVKSTTSASSNGGTIQYNVSTADGSVWDSDKMAEFLSDEQIDKFAKGVAEGRLVDATADELGAFADEIGISTEQLKFLTQSIEETEGATDAIRKYGEAQLTFETQQAAMYDGLANSVVSLVDTLGKSEEQIKQMYNLSDGETYEKFYNEMKSKFADTDFRDDSGDGWGTIKKDSGLTDQQFTEAFAKAGFKNASYSVDTGKITYDDGNVRKTEAISQDQIINILSDYWATVGVTEKAEATSDFTTKLVGEVGTLGDDVAIALSKALQDESGKNLTQADIEALAKIKDWDTLVQNTGYGHLFTGDEIKKKVSDSAATSADKRYAKSNKKMEKLGLQGRFTNLSSGALEVFAEKLTDASSKQNGKENVDKIADLVDDIIEEKGLDATEQEALIQRINQVDWSNAESWKAFQIDLEQTYDYSKEKAEAYTNSLIAAAQATSGLSTTIKEFGELYKATKAVEKATQDITQAQWEYERALKSGGNVEESITKLIAGYQSKSIGQKKMYDESINDLGTEYARGVSLVKNLDLRDYVTFNDDGSINDDRLQELIDSGKLQGDDLKAAKEWLQSLNTQYENSQDALTGLQDTLADIEALEQEGKDAYYELRDMAKEAVLASLQEQIDLQQQQLDATNEARNQLVNKIQEQINKQRQDRQNAEAVQSIEDLRAQQDQLSMDTSGRNALEILGLQEQIAQAEQNYQDQLIDQSIQSLQDANAEAAEQRERQISLAESSLAIYEESAEFQADIDRQLDNLLHGQDADGLGQLIEKHFTIGLGAGEIADWHTSLGSKIAQAGGWADGAWDQAKNDTIIKIEAITEAIKGLGQDILTDANAKATNAMRTEFASKGFKTSDLTEEQLKNIQSYVAKEDQSSISKSKESMDKVGGNYLTEAQYYASRSDRIARGENVESYTDYMSRQAIIEQNEAETSKVAAVQRVVDAHGTDDYDKTYAKSLKEYERRGGTQEEFDEALFAEGVGAPKVVEIGTANTSVPSTAPSAQQNTGYSDKGWWLFNDNDLTDGKNDWGTVNYNGVEYALKGTSEHISGNYGKGKVVAIKTSNEDEGALYYQFSDNQLAKIDLTQPGYTYGVTSGGYTATHIFADSANNLFKKIQFKTGGLADFTGPAWLDGTPSRPEYILNADQTERFFSLIDVLESFNKNGSTPTKSGDNYFDINIQVDKLENDYDVEQMANKIRNMIYEDATYRNVNTINHIR